MTAWYKCDKCKEIMHGDNFERLPNGARKGICTGCEEKYKAWIETERVGGVEMTDKQWCDMLCEWGHHQIGCTKIPADYERCMYTKIRKENLLLRSLLNVAKCPNCDGSGGIPHQISESRFVTRDMALDAGDPQLEGSEYSREEWEQEQCQWCFEKNFVLGEK